MFTALDLLEGQQPRPNHGQRRLTGIWRHEAVRRRKRIAMEFKAVRNHTMEGENKKDGARMFLNQYLFQCPDIMGQRFVQLKKEMGFWKKRKCHVVLDKVGTCVQEI
eukprot:1380347-Amorphochlora_amoeboformis.AAC.1